jgi:hypothetical protein
MLPGEKVSTGIDRLNGIVQKLTQHGYAPTAERNLAKLKTSLQIPALNTLWISIALMNNPSYADVVQTCKRFDTAMVQMDNLSGEVHLTSSTEKVVCSYPKGEKIGHRHKSNHGDNKVVTTHDAKDQEEDNPSDEPDQSNEEEDSKVCHCYCCGSSDQVIRSQKLSIGPEVVNLGSSLEILKSDDFRCNLSVFVI